MHVVMRHRRDVVYYLGEYLHLRHAALCTTFFNRIWEGIVFGIIDAIFWTLTKKLGKCLSQVATC